MTINKQIMTINFVKLRQKFPININAKVKLIGKGFS